MNSLGLSELMIVNPARGGLGAMFIGRDGGLYGVEAIDDPSAADSLGRYFLGEDGTLYQMGDAAPSREGFFLGDDGTLYERIQERLR